MTNTLLKVADVAQRLGVDSFTVRRWITAGDLPAYKIGREWRVEPGDLEAYLAARRTGDAPVDTAPAAVTARSPR